MSWLLQDHVNKARAQGNAVCFGMAIAREDKLYLPEEHIHARMKYDMRHGFGDYLVRNKVRWSERTECMTGDTIIEAEVFCFSRSELEAFLKSIMNYPEETYGNHLGLSEI